MATGPLSPLVKLVYFPLRGRAELTRQILAAADIAHEEEVVSFEEWPSRKPSMYCIYT